MSRSALGVGTLGVNAVRGWAATARSRRYALPNCEIRALSAHCADSDWAAGEAFGVRAVFSDHELLLTQPDIDI
jgi:predicted dehydrogenase